MTILHLCVRKLIDPVSQRDKLYFMVDGFDRVVVMAADNHPACRVVLLFAEFLQLRGRILVVVVRFVLVTFIAEPDGERPDQVGVDHPGQGSHRPTAPEGA